MFTEDDVHRVNSRLDELLADHNPQAIIDRHEFCPFHPEGTVAEYKHESDLRKPRPGMIHQAAEKLALDVSRSWVIGDAPRDIEAGKAAGCKTIWYKDSKLPPSSSAREFMLTVPDAVVSTLREAMDVIAREALVRQASAPEVVPTPAEPQAPAQSEPEPAAAPETRRAATGPKSTSSAKPLMQVLAQKRAAAAAAATAEPAATSSLSPVPVASIASPARLEELAEQILQELQRPRDHHEHDFSISKLLAGILQIISLAVLLLAYFEYRANPQPALLGAIFLQIFTVALLIMGRQK
jgi:histidinol phosphatase-like enzyme